MKRKPRSWEIRLKCLRKKVISCMLITDKLKVVQYKYVI